MPGPALRPSPLLPLWHQLKSRTQVLQAQQSGDVACQKVASLGQWATFMATIAGDHFTEVVAEWSQCCSVGESLRSSLGGQFSVPDNKQPMLGGAACCHIHVVSQWVLNQLTSVWNNVLRVSFNDGRLLLRCRQNWGWKRRHFAATKRSETVAREDSPNGRPFCQWRVKRVPGGSRRKH